MKRKLSAILFLFSLFSGLLQPVMPMVEYFVFQENIIEFLCENREQPELNCEGLCYLQSQIEKSRDASNSNKAGLINIDEVQVLTLTSTLFLTYISPYHNYLYGEGSIVYPASLNESLFHPPRS